MLFHLKRIFILISTLLLSLFLSTSCMYVKNLDDTSMPSSRALSLSLNRLSNSGGTELDQFQSVIKSGDYYIAVGYSTSDLSGLTDGSNTTGGIDFVIAKFNKADLSLISINNLGGTSNDSFFSVIESDGYYIAAGSSWSDLSGLTGGNNTTGSYDFVIARFNKADLSLVTLNNLGGTSWDYFYSIIESDSYYIATGQSFSNLSGLTGGSNRTGIGDDFVIAKFNKADLSLVSINNLGGTNTDSFFSVIESDGYYIAAGYSNSDLSGLTGGSTNIGSYDFVIAKFNKADLSLVSINNLGGTSNDEFSPVIESDNYYLAVGQSSSDLSTFTGGSSSSGGSDFVIAKFNKSDLSLVTLNNLGGTGSDFFSSVIESDNYYLAVGQSGSNLSNFTGGSTGAGGSDFVIAKLNKSDLSLISFNNLGGTGDDLLYSVIESDGNYIAVGYSASDLSELTGGSSTAGNRDFTIIKFWN